MDALQLADHRSLLTDAGGGYYPPPALSQGVYAGIGVVHADVPELLCARALQS